MSFCTKPKKYCKTALEFFILKVKFSINNFYKYFIGHLLLENSIVLILNLRINLFTPLNLIIQLNYH